MCDVLSLLRHDSAARFRHVTCHATASRSRKVATAPKRIIDHSILEQFSGYSPPPLPPLNLGYACINVELREKKPSVYTNRGCIKRTFQERGLPYVSDLALQNVTDLAEIVLWNHQHGIRFFRISSALFPWCSEYSLRELPDFEAIADRLRLVGDLARACGQRLTTHPDHFTILCSPKADVVARSVKELETHGLLFDLMGYEPTPYNKINLHVGGCYGDKAAAMDRFARVFDTLSESVRKRLTIENDDVPNSYSIDDLYPLSQRIGVPLVFDLHHQRFCNGERSDLEAVECAVSTWPGDVRPVVHWSESQEGRKPLAHSDYVEGPFHLYGFDTSRVDVMIESKMKELALLRYRNKMEAQNN